MKKMISFSAILCFLTATSFAQPVQNGMPRFLRWVDNTQIVLNMKRGDDTTPKNYIYNVVSKQYSIAPADAVPTEKTVVVKKGDLFLRENGSEVQLTFDNAEEKNPTVSPDGNYEWLCKLGLF
jgi:dipeptidyl-peptidase 4